MTERKNNDRTRRTVRALGLLSGGLDSTLAARMLHEQGHEVLGLHFSTGFCMVDHRRAIGRAEDAGDPARVANPALRAADDLKVPVEIVDVRREYLRQVVTRPKHGYGAAMNPCIDCRIFMLRKADEIARERGYDVLFTGEVIGQRPKSQTRASLELIERESGTEGRLLRPLCAGHMEATEVERDGRIDRDALGSLHGRGRRKQFELAESWDIDEFPTPGGGCCYLADENFGRRLRDLLSHRDPDSVEPEDMKLLQVGRHMRIRHDLKLIVGRDEPESVFLKSWADTRETRWSQVEDGAGAFAILEGDADDAGALSVVASTVARYSRHRQEPEVAVVVAGPDRRSVLRVEPGTDEDIRPWIL